MRRVTMTLLAAVTLLAFVPAGAAARRGHHQRGRHHARLERFGSDTGTGSSSSSASSNNAGTIQSFKNGVLTVALQDGSTVSGAVTGDTSIECPASAQTSTTHAEGDGGQGGDESGRSGGDDNQAQSSEQGDTENENENQSSCSQSDLTQGAAVQAAELRITGSGNTWKDVELGS